jgi:hypothetical protein
MAASLYNCISQKNIHKDIDVNPINIENKIDMDTVMIKRYPNDKNMYRLIAPKDIIDEYKKKIEDAFKKKYEKHIKKNNKSIPYDLDKILIPPRIIYKENLT